MSLLAVYGFPYSVATSPTRLFRVKYTDTLEGAKRFQTSEALNNLATARSEFSHTNTFPLQLR
jgi:hypothetical protein